MVATIFSAAGILGAMGLAFSLTMIYFSKKFAVKTDPRVDAIINILPNADCGACGMAGCKTFAHELVKDNVSISGCVIADEDVIEKVSDIMCKDSEIGEKNIAKLLCAGGVKFDDFNYDGIRGCNAANLIVGQYKSCRFGCLGFGDCERVCQFDAITMVDSLPVVDEEKCTGCGLCVTECPKDLFELVKKSAKVYVKCRSHSTANAVCKLGCISCRICEKACPTDAIKIENNLAKIDYNKCINCGICAQKCPRKIITLRT